MSNNKKNKNLTPTSSDSEVIFAENDKVVSAEKNSKAKSSDKRATHKENTMVEEQINKTNSLQTADSKKSDIDLINSGEEKSKSKQISKKAKVLNVASDKQKDNTNNINLNDSIETKKLTNDKAGNYDNASGTTLNAKSDIVKTDVNNDIYNIYNDNVIYKERLSNDNFGKVEGEDKGVDENLPLQTIKPKKHKKSFKQRMKALAILIVLGIFTGSGLGVWYYNSIAGSFIDYSQYDVNDYIVSPEVVIEQIEEQFNFEASSYQNFFNEAKSQGVTPADLTPAQNFILAEYKASLASSFHIVGSGSVVANIFGGITQPVYSEKNFDGNNYTFESLSSGTVTVGRCAIMEDGGQNVRFYSAWDDAIHINSSNIKQSYADWSDYQDYTEESYIDLAGSTPDGVQSYIVSEKTIISQNDSSVIEYDETSGYYNFSFKLDPTTSVLRYAKQVQQTSGLESPPSFSSLSQNVTIDEDWNFITISVEEHYSVFMVMSVGCVGTLTSHFTFNDPEAVDFPDGVDLTNIG